MSFARIVWVIHDHQPAPDGVRVNANQPGCGDSDNINEEDHHCRTFPAPRQLIKNNLTYDDAVRSGADGYPTRGST
jgi:hypothetical protein